MDLGFNTGYETTGTPYYVRMVNGYQTLIGLSEQDYRMMLAQGFNEQEVYVSLRRGDSASSEYEIEVRAGLNRITMDSRPLFQLCLDEEPTAQLRDRGFAEGREVGLYIKPSPYAIPAHQIDPKDVALDVFDENDPMLDAPEVWMDDKQPIAK